MKRVFKYYVFVIVILVWSHAGNAQLHVFDATKMDSLLVKGNKDVFVFVYTNWCTYCTAMKQTTFKNDSLVRLLNTHFYFVSFNAESKNDIQLNGITFQYQPSGSGTGIHQLAQALAGDKAPAYPFIGVLNQKAGMIFAHNVYLNAAQLITILNQLRKASLVAERTDAVIQ